MTAAANTPLTAAQWNASVRDNLLTTGPAVASSAGGYIVTSGVNAVVQRNPGSDTVNLAQTATSTSYIDLGATPTPGPDVQNIVSGTRCIVFLTAQMNNNTAGAESISSVAVSGATTIAADDNVSCDVQQPTTGTAFIDITAARCVRLTVTAGSNNYTMKYRVSAGTGTFKRRSVVVLPG